MTVKFFKIIQEDDKTPQRIFQGECKPKFFTFLDGQPHITLSVFKSDLKESFQYGKDWDIAEVHCSIRNPADLFNLGLILDVINVNMPHRKSEDKINVCIYWLFGARMDRRIDSTQPNTSDIVVNTLDIYRHFYNCKYEILDIHNAAIFENGDSKFHENEIGEISIWGIFGRAYRDFYSLVAKRTEDTVYLSSFPDIYFPDKGAKERYTTRGQLDQCNVLFGEKVRDPNTGKLSGFQFKSGEKKSDSIIIFDDLCDGGGTFLGHLEVLKQMGYKYIGLYTTHGVYSKGMAVLDPFDAVYSTNSYILGKEFDEDGYPLDNHLGLRKWDKENKYFSYIYLY